MLYRTLEHYVNYGPMPGGPHALRRFALARFGAPPYFAAPPFVKNGVVARWHLREWNDIYG